MSIERLPNLYRVCRLERSIAFMLLLITMFGQTPGWTQQSGDTNPPGDLATGRYADRQRATLEMWRLRTQSRQAVQDAARDADPEVAERAAWILKQWRSGSLPGVGKSSTDSLLDRGTPSALATVLEAGAFNAVLVAVEESAGTIEFDQIKNRVAALLTERYPFYADKAFAEGSELDLLKLLDAVAVDRNVAMAGHDLGVFLKLKDSDLDDLPSAASVWSASDQAVYRSQLAMLRGDVERSLEFAKQADDAVLLRIARMLADRWSEIADQSRQDAVNAVAHFDKVEAYVWGLVAAYRTNDSEQVQHLVEKLMEQVPDETEPIRNLRWRVLAMHGRMDQAITILADKDPAAAAKVACAASRFRRAEQICGFPLEAIATDLDQWIDDAFLEQGELPAGAMAPAIDRLYSLARLLLNTGDEDNAYRIYRRLTGRQVIISPFGASLREQTLLEMEMANRLDWILELAVAAEENALTQRSQAIIARGLSTEAESFRIVLDRIKLLQPNRDFRERFQYAFQLFRGKTPPNFDTENDFKRLFESIAHHQQIRRTLGRTYQIEEDSFDLEIVDVFLRHGQVELARDALAWLVREGQLDALVLSAETESEQGDNRAAAERWQQVAAKAMEYSPTSELITLDHGLAYAKSVVGMWILAKRAGHQQSVDELENRIRLMFTSPSMSFRKDLADHLRRLDQHEIAIGVLRDLMVITSFGGHDSPDFFRVAVTYVGAIDDLLESNPQALDAIGIATNESIKWSELAVLGLMNTSDYLDTAFVSIPLSVRKTSLQRAIDSRDEALAQIAIDQIEQLDPLNIDVGERMLPELRQSGLNQVADQAFDRLFNHGLQHVDTFRTDATALNNLAWTAAMNERRLDEGLELSERAVAFEPDSVVFRDTLAEVLHLLGRTREAFAIESACLLDQPDDWHLHQQIEKYHQQLQTTE